MSTMNLGLNQVQCTKRRTCTRELAIGRSNHYFAKGPHRPSQHVQSD
jgi:hypothetical protein